MNESSLRDMIAGTIGGVVGTVAGHPQDKIKARLQLHPRRYRSSFDCFLQIVKAEGVTKRLCCVLIHIINLIIT